MNLLAKLYWYRYALISFMKHNRKHALDLFNNPLKIKPPYLTHMRFIWDDDGYKRAN